MKNVIKSCFLLLLFVSLVSCGTQRYSSSRIESVLAVTAKGDTVQVPLEKIIREYGYGGYQGWNFNWNNNWYPYQAFPYYLYRDYRFWQVPIIRYSPIIRNNGTRNEINAYPFRSQRQPQGRSNGGRSWSGQVVPTQPIRPRVTPPSQPGQVRGRSQSPRVQQPVPRSTPSRPGGRRPIQQ